MLLELIPLREVDVPTACHFIAEANEWSPRSQIGIDPMHALSAPNTMWLSAVNEDNVLVGIVGFHNISFIDGSVEVALGVVPEHRNRGVAKQLALMQNDFAFYELGLRRLQMTSLAGSPACAIARSAGLQHEGTLKGCRLKKGNYVDADIYALLKED